jgi:hypothetical protein
MNREAASFCGVILERQCNVCNGSGIHGKMLLGLLDCPCYNCNDGWVLTENGKQLCQFIKSHMTCTEGSLILKHARK